MQVSDEEALSAPSSPASKSQSSARGSLPPLAGHQPLGPDDDPFANEGRGTPRDTTEGLDQDTCRSDHSDPYHTTLGLGSRVSEPKGGIDVLEESSPPDSIGKRATSAGAPSGDAPKKVQHSSGREIGVNIKDFGNPCCNKRKTQRI